MQVGMNRLLESIKGMTPEETYDFLYWLMFEYAKQYTDSRSAVIKWLREGAEDDKRRNLKI